MTPKEQTCMDSAQNGDHNSEIQEESQRNSGRKKLGDYIPIYIPAIQKGLLTQSRHDKEERFLDFLKAHPSNEWFRNVMEQSSAPPDHSPSPSDPAKPRRRRFRVPFARKIKWSFLWNSFKQWIKGPEHIALFIWLLFVAAGIFLLFLVMTGILNEAIPSKKQRDNWSEIINQILNALFTMMALYEHPKFFHHLFLLLRWIPGEEGVLRKVYCKNGAPKRNERIHMLVVVLLLHITCFSQYALCGLYWGFTSATRPDWAENLSIAVGIAAPIMAVLYTIYSPLGRVNDEIPLGEEELQNQQGLQHEPEELQQKIIITSPEWIGGLMDCRDDMTVSCLSFFCTFCVFGWNMERLGFGNMYVHIITFILLCVAPFWVFAIAALNVDNDTIKLILVIAGSLLSVLGLFYAGFWRTEMRKKFKLPGNPFCCSSPTMTDYFQWLFCWSCSLAQEVRTANFYDIEDDGFYRTVTDEEGREVLIPLPREGGLSFLQNFNRSLSFPGTMEAVQVQRISRPISLGRALTAPVFVPLVRVEEERTLMNT
ncbi:uncharacterized protein LOC110023712 [Phalaenopsis equestris]|uniref:uncharacterized protein LOC110023712 n=1 Tax=Phalaenopsis equestris TaxID=78828 RepID=UPI0009E23031|nr:uncharacterized protein LOC110023712 [Phalaenopsis equestris]XP_020578913.1 uncharacterized protein LOC110023712 [Phalaenopsis equestris]